MSTCDSLSDDFNSLPSNLPILIADTGCTAHFCAPNYTLKNIRMATSPTNIRLPDGSFMSSTTEGDLDIPNLPPAACRAHVVPALHNKSLISIGQLCDAGCKVHFDSGSATISHDGNVIFTGSRSPTSKLWTLQPVLPVPTAQALTAVGSAKPADLVAFAHAALFSPALSTLAIALKRGFLLNFPGLTEASLRKYPPHSRATVKGHLDQTRTNIQSTKTSATPAIQEISVPILQDDLFPEENIDANDMETFFADVIDVPAATGQIYTDQTGRFVSPSSTGNNYIFVLYDYDSNAILAKAMPSRTGASILTAYKALHEKLVQSGRRPHLQRLDNECSKELKQFMTEEKIKYQLVPPGIHRRNSAERAIRTFKNHFIAGLCSTDPLFPIHLWDHLLDQAILTLNLLRGSRINHNVSAWAQLNGHFDFNSTPLAPPGIKVLVHNKPAKRGTWAPHAIDGWYVGPALDSYRCYKCWIIETQAIRITDTVEWFPHKIPMPTPSTDDLILAGINDILTAIRKPTHNTTLGPLATSTVAALQNLQTMFSQEPEWDVDQATATSLRVKSLPEVASAPTHITEPIPTHITEPIHSAVGQHNQDSTLVTQAGTPSNSTSEEPSNPVVHITNHMPEEHVGINEQLAVLSPDHRNDTYPELVSHEGRKQTTRRNRNKRTARSIRNNKTTIRGDALNAETIVSHTTTETAYLGHAVNPDTGKIADYRTLLQCSEGHLWSAGASDEFGRLMKGNNTTTTLGTDTMRFISHRALPQGITPTYASFVCSYRPEKEKPYRVRITVGGDRVEYAGETTTKTADLLTTKVHFNKVISTPNAKFMTLDIKDYYLNTPMSECDYVYMRIPLAAIPDDIKKLYEVDKLIHNGFAYVQIRQGMYGLKQAGRLANDLLQKNLAPYGYHPVPITPGLWRHDSRPISFTLVVDDFGVCYTDKKDVEHLIQCLRTTYQISIDWSGRLYCGLTIDWDYDNRTCDISMPGFIERALQRFEHAAPTKQQHSPHRYTVPTYGSTTQLTDPPDASPALDASNTKRVQEIIGTLLYYARAVDPTLLTALSTLATQQARGTQQTMKDITQLLNYCATHPDATIRYYKSNMILHVESDASYLSEKGARSRVAGYYYLSNPPPPNSTVADENHTPMHNGPIHILCNLLKEVLSSAAEAELAGLFHNGKEACPLRIMLEELGYPQPPTPLQTDNSTAFGIINDTVKQRRSKAIDMRFYWMRDRVRQGQFYVYWKKGSINKADYFTKHHPKAHHQTMRPSILHVATHNRFTPLSNEGVHEGANPLIHA